MANAVGQGWKGTVCKHCPADPLQGLLRLSNISQKNVPPRANALEPGKPGVASHPADRFGFDKLVFFCGKWLI